MREFLSYLQVERGLDEKGVYGPRDSPGTSSGELDAMNTAVLGHEQTARELLGWLQCTGA